MYIIVYIQLYMNKQTIYIHCPCLPLSVHPTTKVFGNQHTQYKHSKKLKSTFTQHHSSPE